MASIGSSSGRTIFLSVASGKGGVGKSSVTVNLATALTELGYQVGIADCDIYGSSIPHMLGIKDSRMPLVNDMMLPVDVNGIKVVSLDFLQDENKPVVWRGPMLSKAIHSFLDNVLWGELDYLLLDLPPGTGDVALDVHERLPLIQEILVTTPHPTAAYVAYRAGCMALDVGHPIVGVVENMAYYRPAAGGEPEYILGQGGGEQLAQWLDVPLLGRIPLGNSHDGQTEVYAEGTEARDVFRHIAGEMAAILSPTKVSVLSQHIS